MVTFVSLVGQRPAAVAVPLTTWQRRYGNPARVLLLATPPMVPTADRIGTFFSKSSCEIVPLEGELRPDVPILSDWIRSELAGSDVVFSIDAGLKAFVARVERELPTPRTSVYSDTDGLHVCRVRAVEERWEGPHPVDDLGLDALLRLCGLSPTSGGALPGLLQDCLDRAGIDLGRHPTVARRLHLDRSSPVLDLAFERGGWLYGLVAIERRGDTLQRVRDLEQLQLRVAGLQPRLTVLSDVPSVLSRARAARIRVVDLRWQNWADQLTAWIKGDGRSRRPLPGVLPSSVTVRGTGGQGPALVVCLGTNAGSTLVSLCTHRPKHAWVFFDQHTPGVIEVAQRLMTWAGALPIGELHCLPTDLVGKNIRQQFESEIGRRGGQYGPEHLRADVSPGSKAQAAALARLPIRELWALRAEQGRAECLTDGSHPPVALAAPDLLTQMRIVGGHVPDGSWTADTREVKRHQRFLTQLLRVLAAWARERMATEGPLTYGRLRSLQIGVNSIQIVGDVVTVACSGAAPQQIQVSKAMGSSGRPLFPIGTGHWFESVIAAAFLAAGADEVLTGVRVPWPGGAAADQPTMNEIDVLVRLGHRFLAVSCKTEQVKDVSRALREIADVARRTLDRRAVPVLVVIKASRDRVAASLKAPRGAILLDAADLAEAGALRDTLERVFLARSTVARAEDAEDQPLAVPSATTQRVVIQKVDLDTALTALILGAGDGDQVAAVRDTATTDDLDDPEVICIECGGSGLTHLNNFDHHNTAQPLPPACRQAIEAAGLAGNPDLLRLVNYVAALDVGELAGQPAPFPNLSTVFGGMLLITPDPVEQLKRGLAILRRVLDDEIDPAGRMPEIPPWQPYLAAKRANDERLRTVLARVRPFTTAGGLRAAFLEHDEVGGLGMLYREGYRVVILYSPHFGTPPVPKYTIGGDRVRVDGLLPVFDDAEPGWGAPSHGTIVGSARTGSTLTPDRVITIVQDHL
ncbi:MAG: hypothetical protein HY331_03745 [Chloroflexi bacterium]|nr:hypothetical protein [Chloroflexota bacterium]